MVKSFPIRGMSRRRTLQILAAAGASAAPIAADAQPASGVRLLPGANVCMVTPQAVEGPFYFDPKLERADITEGRPGVPLGLLLQVVEARDCTPLKAARVDIWHADALGLYSGYDRQSDARNVSTKGEHFLRGTQFTDALGQASFTTVYPGWYRGRTAHIHCKVFLDRKTVLTTQLYFPDALSEFIYKNVKPYNARGAERDTVNATDGVLKASDQGHTSFVSIKEEPSRYLASLVIGVSRDGKDAARFEPSGPPPDIAGRGGSLVPGIVKSE